MLTHLNMLDIHAHLYPPAYGAALARMGGDSARLATGLERAGARSPHFRGAMAERVDMLDRLGIQQQVLSLPAQWVLSEDPAVCIQRARVANDVLAEECQRSPGRFAFFANLPLVDPDAAAREVERCLADAECVGVVFPTHVLGQPLDWDLLRPIYAEIERHEVPLFLHPGPPPYSIAPPGQPEFGLGSALYFPTEDADALLRLVLSGTLALHPRLRVICPHLGGVIPFILWRIDEQCEGRMPDGNPLPLPPSQYLLHNVLYDTVTRHPPAMRCAHDTFGPERLLFGTDFPFVDEQGIREILDAVDGLALDASQRQALLDGRARQWLYPTPRSSERERTSSS
ncbi:MAG: amidohydrolase family protein [Chloroflexi bacterium]|nr:amidohydrolase family protein [Chloroflexota bacterium]